MSQYNAYFTQSPNGQLFLELVRRLSLEARDATLTSLAPGDKPAYDSPVATLLKTCAAYCRFGADHFDADTALDMLQTAEELDKLAGKQRWPNSVH